MSSFQSIEIKTNGESFYDITSSIKSQLQELVRGKSSGILTLFTPHTSCALCINESYDPSAKEDLESFLKHLAPRNLSFIKHTAEGEDDSPSHMKSVLLQSSLQFIVDGGGLVLGTWQGVYLCEFRDSPKSRQIYLKFQEDLK